MRIMLNRIAVTNPWTDKITPDMQVAQVPGGAAINEHSHNRTHGDGAPYDGKPRKNQDILRELPRFTIFPPHSRSRAAGGSHSKTIAGASRCGWPLSCCQTFAAMSL